jgi:sialic acid synthase SpsE
MIVLEVGINHFGSVSLANSYLDFFLKSDFEYLTFQIQTEKFYKKFFKKINFELPVKFYFDAIEKAKNKNKKIGLAVCDVNSFKKYENLNFDFYKLLGISINNYKLIDMLSLKKKEVFISLAKGTDNKIYNCIKRFNSKNKLRLIYTSMSYEPKDLNLKRINYLKKKFKIPVGYGHHYKDETAIFCAKTFNIPFIFLYVKNFKKDNRKFPDDQHAFFIKDLDILINKIRCVEIFLKNSKINTTIKIDEKIRF